MSALLVIGLVAIVIGAVGNGFRGALRVLTSAFRTPPGRRRSRAAGQQNTQLTAVIFIILGVIGAFGALVSQNGGTATFAAVMLGIGVPLLVLCIYRGIGITQPPLYAWLLVAGIVISPYGLITWYGAVIAAEIMAAGLLLLWFDRKDKILDTFGTQPDDPAKAQYARLRRTAIVLIVLACTVAFTAISARFVWLWFIVIGLAAAYYVMRRRKAVRKAREEEEAARAEEVERILNTKIPGLDDEDDELLEKYLHTTTVPLRKGERRPLNAGDLEIRLTGAAPGGDLDCYVFLLGKDSRVRNDRDLIFFGQDSSPDGSVRVVNGVSGPGTDISLGRIPQNLDGIVVAFALGVDAPPEATWKGGTVVLEDREGTFTYPVPADGKTRSVNALRLYRHDGGWKLWITDHRSIRGITELCDEYGVDVA